MANRGVFVQPGAAPPKKSRAPWIVGGGLALAVLAGYAYVRQHGVPEQVTHAVQAAGPQTTYPTKLAYPEQKQPDVPLERDKHAELLALLRQQDLQRQQEMDALRQKLAALEARPQVAPAPAVAEKPAAEKKPVRWTVADAMMGKPPFERPKPTEDAEGQLIKQAVQEIPAVPEKTLYRSQFIPGVTMDEIKPDLPGQIRIYVSQPVMDRFGQQSVLIPQHSILIAQQLDVPEYGETRFAVGVEELQFPDGSIVQLKGQTADKSGALGLRTRVSGNWGRIIAASLISGVMSIGATIPAGNPDNYYLTVPQQVARQAGQAMNQAGQQVVNRELQVRKYKPVPPATPVTIQLHENLSLAQAPRVIK